MKIWYQCWIFKIKNIFRSWIYTYLISTERWGFADSYRVWIKSFGVLLIDLWRCKHGCIVYHPSHYTQKLTFKIWYQSCIIKIENISHSPKEPYYTSIWRWSSVVYWRILIMPFGVIFNELWREKDSSTFEK